MSDAFNLVKGLCPECGSKFKEDKDRPMMLVCANKNCPYEIDTVTYFETVDELFPPSPDSPSDDPDNNLKRLSKL